MASATNYLLTKDPSSKPMTIGVFITWSPQLHFPIATVTQKLGLRLSSDYPLTTLAVMAASTQTPFSEPCSNITTLQITTPSCLWLCVYLVGQSGTSYIHPEKYHPHSTWRETLTMLTSREEALHNCHIHTTEWLTEHTHPLPPQVTGDCIRIQNQTRPHPKK